MKMGKTAIKFLLLLVSSLLLSSCSLLVPAKAYNPTLYRLNPHISQANKISSPSQLSLLVLPTIASPELNTRKMAYALGRHQIAYYAQNSWVARPTQMLSPLITQALRKNGYFYAVVPAPFAGKTNLILYTQLLALEQDFTTHPSTVHMILAAQVINVNSSKILGAHQFSVVVPTPEGNPAGGAYAANQATAQILQELTQFCVQVSGR